MKIKAVSDATGLSDRTIRYYIEQALIFPPFSENYLGRKSFDFSQDNVEELKSISVLRKFDFTIEEIREIIHDAETSKTVIQAVKIRTEQAVAAGQMRQFTLSQIDVNKAYTVAELAQELSKASETLPKTSENIKKNIGEIILTAIKAILVFLLVWLPVAFQFLFFSVTLTFYEYPEFFPEAISYMILSVLPSLLMVLLGRIQKSWKRIAKVILLIFCAISLLCSFLVSILPAGMMAISETTDFADYCELDADCLASGNPFFRELFPAQPHYFENVKQADGHYETVYLDAHYYYRFLSIMDYTYDIYAEWPLEKEEFDKEVSRVQALYETRETYDIVHRGNYTCYFTYHGAPPFEEVTDSYTYYIFAYDETNLIVRYIMCDSLENGADQPYYLSLDW